VAAGARRPGRRALVREIPRGVAGGDDPPHRGGAGRASGGPGERAQLGDAEGGGLHLDDDLFGARLRGGTGDFFQRGAGTGRQVRERHSRSSSITSMLSTTSSPERSVGTTWRAVGPSSAGAVSIVPAAKAAGAGATTVLSAGGLGGGRGGGGVADGPLASPRPARQVASAAHRSS